MSTDFTCAGKRVQCNKNPAAAGCLGCLLCDRDLVRHRTAVTVLRSRFRPKLPATAVQRAVTRESAGCRDHLPIGYRAWEGNFAFQTFCASAGYGFGGYYWLDCSGQAEMTRTGVFSLSFALEMPRYLSSQPISPSLSSCGGHG